jgi:F-type H+-transporting ATPase subunit gamma
MGSLKELKNRIKTIKSTQKITKAMKMVAASKLRKSKDLIWANRPYTEKMNHLLGSVLNEVTEKSEYPILFGTGEKKRILLVVASSERGLCGSFNSAIAKMAAKRVLSIIAQQKECKVLCLGKKAFEILSMQKLGVSIDFTPLDQEGLDCATEVAKEIQERFNQGEFDECYVIYSKFISVISRKVSIKRIIPFSQQIEMNEAEEKGEEAEVEKSEFNKLFNCEPEPKKLLSRLISSSLVNNILHVVLENAASENSARMTAMDNATRNANEMLKKLSITYNRSRQAAITTELTEIISGAEALNG